MLANFGAKLFRADLCINNLVKIGFVTTVTVGDMTALSHLTHRDMGNVTMMSGTSLIM
ncbi:hypothetical protein SPWS13_0250 [Shewanella putrefaciens]|nr:conserved hypothetical protein [Shewanella sp. W3-18-1]AVV82110.1 hypothetical protein SPWS13_0250 [Shewanella putrefaciens]